MKLTLKKVHKNLHNQKRVTTFDKSNQIKMENTNTMSKYVIERECWNEKTFNGYQDNPYWRIDFQDMGYVLLDDGRVWCTNGMEISDPVLDDIRTIIKECKLNIESLIKL